MKMLLIKIGKAWSVIRRDGVARGGRRVLEAFAALFARVEPGDILFISGGVGDSARYRTTHVAEELRLRGFRTSVTVQDNPRLLSYADQFQVFVFHRVLMTPVVARLMERLKAAGSTVIFETDDLVYDPAFLVHMDYFTQMNALERKLYEHGVGGEILADSAVTVATTTTNFLADKLREKGKTVYIVPNRLSEQDVLWAGEAIEQKAKNSEHRSMISDSGDVVRVGYLSGTPSHNKDFATVTDVLIALFEKFPEMRLVLAGPLDTENRLQMYADRIQRLAFVPRHELFANIASLDINLAPLEIGNPFCESKSELKFFEAGIVSVPTVAAATQTFREAITDGTDGFVAANTDEWTEKIGRLITDAELRLRMGRAARETALEEYTNANAKNEVYYEYVRTVLKKH
ncbi:MAG: glycosyltransferase family 4 protein [Candidatus Moraniibacteriota bacterium]